MNVLLISLLSIVLALSSASAQEIRWCVKSQNELKKCKYLATKQAVLKCVLRTSIDECMESISASEADAINVDGEHVYKGGLLKYNLHPIISESYKKERCYSVALVKRDADFTINELRGKTSCNGCTRICMSTIGGWNIPIGRLIAEGKIPWDGPDDKPLEQAVSDFFSSSCVPGVSKTLYPNLCKACNGDCSATEREKYHGGAGAIQCLKDGAAQVAFVCHDTIPESEKQNYQLLCMDGSRKSVDSYKDCNLGKEPARAVISRMDTDAQHIYKLLQSFSASDLFSSNAFGGKDLMFSDSASGLVELPKNTNSFLYLNKDYYLIMEALRGRKNKLITVLQEALHTVIYQTSHLLHVLLSDYLMKS